MQLSISTCNLWCAVLLLAASRAMTAEPNTADFPASEAYFGLAQVSESPGAVVHFVRLLEYQCETDAPCSDKSLFVVGGDKLLTGGTDSEGVYAWYRVGRKYLRGWLPPGKIKNLPFDRNPALRSWEGTWTAGTAQRIVIKVETGSHQLTVGARAEWYGTRLADGQQVVHKGDVTGSATPEGNRLVIRSGDKPYQCVLVLELVGEILGAEDNMHCGGMNVGFSDAYVRDAAAKSASN